jgi:hypothetical protein
MTLMSAWRHSGALGATKPVPELNQMGGAGIYPRPVAGGFGGFGGGVDPIGKVKFGGGGGASTKIKYRSTGKYNPNQGQAGGGQAGGGQLQQNLGQMSQYGQDLMDPNSAYYQQLQDQMTAQLGEQGAAQQRASGLRAAYSGFDLR